MHTSTASPARVSALDDNKRLNANDIPDVSFDGSKQKSTFWLSLMTPVLMAVTLLVWMLGSNLTRTNGVGLGIAGGVAIVFLSFCISQFPTQASSRFVTQTLKRPTHFIPTAVSVVAVLILAALSASQTSMLDAYNLTAVAAGNFSAIFLAFAITTCGRYALNYIAMTQRLFVLLICGAGSFMVQDQTLLAMGVMALAIDLLWHIQLRWTPLVALPVVHPNM